MDVNVFENSNDFIKRVEKPLSNNDVKFCSMLGMLPALETLNDSFPETLFLATVSPSKKESNITLVVIQYSAWHGMHIANLSSNETQVETAVDALVAKLMSMKVKLEAVISDPITARAFANSTLETTEWVHRVGYAITRELYTATKVKQMKDLAPGELVKLESKDVDIYSDKFHDVSIDFWGDFAPINTQCREALRDAALRGWLFAHKYRGHMVSFCIVRSVTSKKARFTTLFTPRGYRGRGFGITLLINAMKYLRKHGGITKFMMFVDEDDHATDVYKSIGFRGEHTIHVYEVLLRSAVNVNKHSSLQGTVPFGSQFLGHSGSNHFHDASAPPMPPSIAEAMASNIAFDAAIPPLQYSQTQNTDEQAYDSDASERNDAVSSKLQSEQTVFDGHEHKSVTPEPFNQLQNVVVDDAQELEVSPHDNGHVHNHTDDSDDNDKKDDIDHNSTEKLEEKPDVPDIQTDAYVDVRELLEPTITHF